MMTKKVLSLNQIEGGELEQFYVNYYNPQNY